MSNKNTRDIFKTTEDAFAESEQALMADKKIEWSSYTPNILICTDSKENLDGIVRKMAKEHNYSVRQLPPPKGDGL